MSQSIWERRQAVASRLEEHGKVDRVVKDEFATALAAASLQPADVDPHGHLARAVTAVAHLAAGDPGYDVVLGLPSGAHGVRVHTGPDGRVVVAVVSLSVAEPAPAAVASELAALLWQR
ncbi:hypothetical protein [Kineococcus rhizosphaerae]|uniref:Uncharacterized protein n=1 Tax=Kineococcus rhizosphaerae TaxID=559628 RepID=A0A2T0R053_9ACTN|nr:hypothetical protein [Kineococcus rhizosphaerae]PRY12511.1 hypothetical protein CLV37_11071 [Kineococcus rhizosphaerae]